MAQVQELSPEAWRGRSSFSREVMAGAGHIPTSVMLDYAYGGLDDEILEALYGGHIASCSPCQHGIAAYRQRRPSDPARLCDLPEFSPCEYQSTNYGLSREEAGERLKTFLGMGSGPLLIVAGEANPAVYTPELGDVLRRRADLALRSGDALPEVICGPAMGLNEQIRTAAETIFPALAEEGAIRLYSAQHRQRLHFRVSGEDSVYTEEYHKAGNPGDRRGYWYKSQAIANLFRRRFQAIRDAKLAYPAKREDFVYLPMDTIRQIENRVGAKFDSMTSQELATASRV